MSHETLSDVELIARLKRLVLEERRSLTELISHLAELDRRKLYADEGYPSLFVYCTQALGYAEGAAYKRIQTARASARFPEILRRLEAGRIHMTAIVVLAPHLTEDNCEDLLQRAEGRSKRELEALVASIHPRRDLLDNIQRIPERPPPTPKTASPQPVAGEGRDLILATPAGTTDPPSPPAEAPHQKIEHLTPERVHFGFTGSEELRRKIEYVKRLLRHKLPAGHLEDVVGELVEFYLERKDPGRRIQRKLSRKGAPAPMTPSTGKSRYIPQPVRDLVWQRDGGRCAFVTATGKRCEEDGGLEFDHVIPWALGGRSDDPANIRLLCRTHNQLSARKIFGDDACP